MNFFVCLLDPQGHDVPDVIRRTYESLPRSHGLAFRWHTFTHAQVLTASDVVGASLVASDGVWIATGTVRLDNRAELERLSGGAGSQLSDLAVVLGTIAAHGTKYVPNILGDFAFVAWNATTREAVAACDPFAVRQLYYAEHNGLIAFASRAEALALSDQYTEQYLAELVAMCSPSPELTVYAGVHPVAAGTMVMLHGSKLTARAYWSPENFAPEPARAQAERETVDECRQLLIDSVQLRMAGNGDIWAQLSGGLDSSSVVSIAQWLLERGAIPSGLAGTVTYVDRQGTGSDEREYSSTVVNQWRVRNETIIDPPIWDDGRMPPRTDQPRLDLPLYPRERRLCAIVRDAGGRVLLTGVGSDELFTGIMFFFADWIATGRVWPAVREMARRAAIGRASFWELAYCNAILPLLPRPIQQRLAKDQGQMPPWVPRTIARQYGLRARSSVASTYGGRAGRKYHHAIVTNLMGVRRLMDYGVIGDALDVRHPFLYRPLVEFALRLPPELCVRPYARKWVLREAMRGLLPEAVRTRVGKGTTLGLVGWSLAAQQTLLEPLVHNPILADLGLVDATQLRVAFDAAPHQPQRRDALHGTVQATLVIEAWLQLRSGRWPRGGHRSSGTTSDVSRAHFHHPSARGELGGKYEKDLCNPDRCEQRARRV